MRECDCGYVLVASEKPEPMGDRLMQYCLPLLDQYQQYEGDLSFEEFKAIFEFAAFLWNLAAVEDIQKAIRHVEKEMPPRLRLAAYPARTMVRTMIMRRKTDFADDLRLALDVKVYRRDGQVRVKALGVRFEPGPSRATSPSGRVEAGESKPPRVLH